MINISEDYKERIKNNLISNTVEILFPNNSDIETITQANMSSESMKIKQSICDESKLKFGGCIASEFNIDLVNTLDRSFDSSLVGEWITVKLTQKFASDVVLYPSNDLYPDDEQFPGYEKADTQVFYLFSGYIDSAKVSKSDNNVRNIVAYDAMAILNELGCTGALSGSFHTTGDSAFRLYALIDILNCLSQRVTLNIGTMGKSTNGVNVLSEQCLLGYTNENFNILGYYPAINYEWRDNTDQVTCGELIRNICEMIGCFGYIRPNYSTGEFCIKSISEEYGSQANGYETLTEEYDFYESLYVEEYTCKGYTAVNLRVSDNDEEHEAYSKTSVYDFECDGKPDDAEKNVYDMTDSITAVFENDATGYQGSLYHKQNTLYNAGSGSRLYDSEYIPFTATLDGRPWVEVGDHIKITRYVTDVEGNYEYEADGTTIKTETAIESIILSRTLSGIQCLTDEFETKGEF